MGLDMHLYKKSSDHFQEEEVGYWRKANAIHKWFVDNVQNGEDDCGKYKVTTKQLYALRQTCYQIMQTPALSDKLLPTQSGFFFGSTSYEDGYFQDIKETIDIIDRVLYHYADNEGNAKDDTQFSYRSSW